MPFTVEEFLYFLAIKLLGVQKIKFIISETKLIIRKKTNLSPGIYLIWKLSVHKHYWAFWKVYASRISSFYLLQNILLLLTTEYDEWIPLLLTTEF